MDGKGVFQQIRDAYQSVRDFQTRMGDTAAGKVWDSMSEGVAHAITDIRQKVVEEPWFGRAVTPELVKQVDQTTVHGKMSDGVEQTGKPAAGIHGDPAPKPNPGAPEAGVHGTSGPKPTPGGAPNEASQPEKPSVYREKVEGLFDPQNRQGQSFAEAVAERYGWGKDFWPMQKDIAEHGRGEEKAPEQDHGMDR